MSGAYGIDFGTTNSVVARATASQVETIQLEDKVPGEWAQHGFGRVLPSVIGFLDGGSDPVFGWDAKRQPTDKLEAVKRLFAKEDAVDIGGRELKVEEAAAMFFRHLQQRTAAAGLTTRLDRAVVTIPANSRGVARYRTKLSAGLAGIEVTALINEPTAAAMAHARRIRRDQRILVFDWGGGTLDVTILESQDGAFVEEASKGVQRLGGIDLDERFMDQAVPHADRLSTSDRNQLRLDLELAKIRLSTENQVQVPMPGGGYLEVTRTQFEEAVRPLVMAVRAPVEVCLTESPGPIDHLVMVGGSSKVLLAQRIVSETVGIMPSLDVDPMTAVAEGAAIAAGILQGTITDLDFFVGTEHALGTIVSNPVTHRQQFSVLIPRNTKYPARATDSYVPALDDQERVTVEVIEGDPSRPIDHEDNVVLKEWSIELLGKRPSAEAAFDITYEYDLDGILHVLVEDKLTRRVMMNEELAFGAAEDKSQLPLMRGRVDALMDDAPVTTVPGAAQATRLSPESAAVLARARDKILPFLPEPDRTRMQQAITALETAAGTDEEPAYKDELEHETRRHAYLL